MKTKGYDIGFKDVDLKQGIVSGWYSTFEKIDSYKEITDPGATIKTVAERGPQGKKLIKYCLDHKKDQIPGVLIELGEDDIGGFYAAKIGKHNLGLDFTKMVESDIINQHSFGYKEIKTIYDEKLKVTRLKEVFLYEISALQFLGANEDTTRIDLKSFDDCLSYIDRLEKFIKTTDCTDETIIELENKLKSLHALLKPGKPTPNSIEADDQLREIFKSFGKNGN